MIRFLTSRWNLESENLPDEVMNLWIFTIWLTLSGCRPHTSSVWAWSGVPKVHLYNTFLGGLHQLQDVMPVGLLEDFLSLKLLIEHFMSCMHTALHQFILFRVRCTCGALDVIRSFTDVPVISIYTFKRIEKMSQAIAKNSNVVIWTRKKVRWSRPNFHLRYQPQSCNNNRISIQTCERNMGCHFEPDLAEGFYSLFSQQTAGSC